MIQRRLVERFTERDEPTPFVTDLNGVGSKPYFEEFKAHLRQAKHEQSFSPSVVKASRGVQESALAVCLFFQRAAEQFPLGYERRRILDRVAEWTLAYRLCSTKAVAPGETKIESAAIARKRAGELSEQLSDLIANLPALPRELAIECEGLSNYWRGVGQQA
jgi:hypothetical protein